MSEQSNAEALLDELERESSRASDEVTMVIVRSKLRATVLHWAQGLNVEAVAKLQHERDALTERLEELHHAYDTLEAEHDKCRAAVQAERGSNVTTQQYRDVLLQCLVTLRHASVFVRTREKMHPTGIELYDHLVKDVENALKAPRPELASVQPNGDHDAV